MTPKEQLIELVRRQSLQGEAIRLILAQQQANFGRLQVAIASRPLTKIAEALHSEDEEKMQLIATNTKEMMDAVDRLVSLMDKHNQGSSAVLDEIETICRDLKEKLA